MPRIYVNHSFDSDTHYLYPSKTQFMKRASRLSTVVLRVLAVLGFTELTTLPDGTILEATNLTLFNVLLLRFGPMREKRLTQTLIVVQVRHCQPFSRVTCMNLIFLACGKPNCLFSTLRSGLSRFRWRSALASYRGGLKGEMKILFKGAAESVGGLTSPRQVMYLCTCNFALHGWT
jgi:hypothetical protein